MGFSNKQYTYIHVHIITKLLFFFAIFDNSWKFWKVTSSATDSASGFSASSVISCFAFAAFSASGSGIAAFAGSAFVSATGFAVSSSFSGSDSEIRFHDCGKIRKQIYKQESLVEIDKWFHNYKKNLKSLEFSWYF